MGFYIRKAFTSGPIRFNLSKSGFGASVGVTGARVGLSSEGRAYVHGGRGGLYYRESLGGGSRKRGAARPASGGRPGPRETVELTEETEATYGVAEQPEEPDPFERPGRRRSRSLLAAPVLIGALLLAAGLGQIPWAMAAAGSLLAGLGAGLLPFLRSRAADAYGRLLRERLAAPRPVTDADQAEIEAARRSRWLAPAEARLLGQEAYAGLLEEGMAGGWSEAADVDRLQRAGEALALDPGFIRREKLNAYRREHIEATADHDLTEAEGAALQRMKTAFGLADADLEEELALLRRLRKLRAIREGALPRVEGDAPLRSGEVCHLQSEGRLLKSRVLRSFSRDRQKYKVRGFVVDKAGTLVVTSRRVLLIHQGTTSIPVDRILDLEVDADRQLLTLTRDDRVRPAYLTTPEALEAGAIIASLADC